MVNSVFRVSGNVKYSGARIGIVIKYSNIRPTPPLGNAKLIGLSWSKASSSVLSSKGWNDEILNSFWVQNQFEIDYKISY